LNDPISDSYYQCASKKEAQNQALISRCCLTRNGLFAFINSSFADVAMISVARIFADIYTASFCTTYTLTLESLCSLPFGWLSESLQAATIYWVLLAAF
jgi:hypothetical protein